MAALGARVRLRLCKMRHGTVENRFAHVDAICLDHLRRMCVDRHTRARARSLACMSAKTRLGISVFTCSRNAKDLQSALGAWKARGLQVEVIELTALRCVLGMGTLFMVVNHTSRTRVQGCVADVSSLEQRTLLVEKVAAAFDQRLHVLVNNVGTNIRKPTVEYTSAEFQTIMSTNLESAFNLCQLCQPLLQASGNGCILFNSSVAGGPTAMWYVDCIDQLAVTIWLLIVVALAIVLMGLAHTLNGRHTQ
eukprot:365325-Chlamydomonas_euryale.AAC.26